MGAGFPVLGFRPGRGGLSFVKKRPKRLSLTTPPASSSAEISAKKASTKDFDSRSEIPRFRQRIAARSDLATVMVEGEKRRMIANTLGLRIAPESHDYPATSDGAPLRGSIERAPWGIGQTAVSDRASRRSSKVTGLTGIVPTACCSPPAH